MTLNDVERQSPLWAKIKSQLEADLAQLRAMNDSMALTTEQTSAIRGEIARVKKYLRLESGEDRP